MSTARTTEKLKTHHYSLRSLGTVEHQAAEEKKRQAAAEEESKRQAAEVEVLYSRPLYYFMKAMEGKVFSYKDKEGVRDLIRKGASVNYCEKGDEIECRMTSPYIMALKNGNASVIKMCLEAGADVNEDILERNFTFPLVIAIDRGHVAAVKILIEHKADLEKELGGPGRDMTALLVAADEVQADIVKILLDAGANPKHRSTWGGNALNYAVEGYDRAYGELIVLNDSKDDLVKIKEDFKTIMGYLVPLLKDEPVNSRGDSDPDYQKIINRIQKNIVEYAEYLPEPVRLGVR